ncbi:MAG: tetratricopeptide repeat protein [Desulfomonile sp.]|nr:tetratricopeptide repeat protein [Desulfomonile sp.]
MPIQAVAIYAFFFAAGLLCHWWGLEARTVYDGAYFVSSKKTVFESYDVLRVISMVPARPFFLFSFYVNFLLSGLDPFYLRIGNIAITAAGGLALAYLAAMIFSTPGLGLSYSLRVKQAVSGLAGIIFVIHPLQNFVNLYIWQREAALACLFVFTGLAVYVAIRSGRIAGPFIGYVLVSVTFLLGMLSKENVAVLPLLMLMAELSLFRQDFRGLLSRGALIVVTLLPGVIAYLFITWFLHAPHSELEQGIIYRLSVYYAAGGITFAEVVMTQCRVFFSYLFMMLFPFAGDVEFMRAVTVSRSLLNPPETLVAAAGVLAIAALGIALIRRSPVTAFGIGVMIISLLPESLLIPQYLFFGYRAVLPMAGLLLILAFAILPAAEWVSAKSSKVPAAGFAAAAAVMAVLCGLGWVTAERASRWTHISFWTDLADKLPPYSEDVQKIPFLDITANCMSVLAAEGLYQQTVDLFHRIAAGNVREHSTRTGHTDAETAIGQFVSTYGDTGGRAGGALISLGVALQQIGRQADAVTAYRKSVELDSRHCDVHITLGVLTEDAGNLEEAIGHYRRAVETDPGSAVAYNCLGNALKKSGKVFEAMQEYAKAIAVAPKAVMGHHNLAIALQETGYLREAIAEYRNALACEPDSADLHHKLGRALAEVGELTEACEHYRKAVSLQPGLAPAKADLALALETTGDLPAALEQYKEAVSTDPNSPIILMFFGRALFSGGRLAEAATVLNRAIALDPAQPASHYLLGLVLERTGSLSQALAHFRTVAELDPGFADGHRHLGLTLCRLGNFEESIRHLKTAELLDPSDQRTCLYLGFALESTGAPAAAAAYYRAALGLKPDFAEAHYGLARTLHAAGNVEEAVGEYYLAILYAPDMVEAHADMAVALLQLNRVAEAIVTLGKALSLNKENTQLFYALGVAYAKMSDNTEAVKYLQKVLDMQPDHVAASEHLRALRERMLERQ